MEPIFALILVVLLFDVASLLWGADSRDGLNSPEWERRQLWRGFH